MQGGQVVSQLHRQCFVETLGRRLYLSSMGMGAPPDDPPADYATEELEDTSSAPSAQLVDAAFAGFAEEEEDIEYSPAENLLDSDAIVALGAAQRLGDGSLQFTVANNFGSNTVVRAIEELDFLQPLRVEVGYQIDGTFPEGFAIQFAGASFPIESLGGTGRSFGLVGNSSGEKVLLVVADGWVPSGSLIEVPSIELAAWEVPEGVILEDGVLQWVHAPAALAPGEHIFAVEYLPIDSAAALWRVSVDGVEAMSAEEPSIPSVVGEPRGRVAIGSATGPPPSGATQTLVLDSFMATRWMETDARQSGIGRITARRG